MDGTISLDGQGNLQEHLAGSIGLSVGVFDAERAQLHTGSAPLPPPDWSPAADVGVGTLGVAAAEGIGHNLQPCGAQVSDRRRPRPGLPPRLTHQERVGLDGRLVGSLTSSTIIDASAQLADTRGDAHSVGSTTARAHVPLTVRLDLSDGFHTVSLHLTDPTSSPQTALPPEDIDLDKRRVVAITNAPAGTVEIDGVARRGLWWRAQTTTITTTWSEALESSSDGDWLGDGGRSQESLEGRSSVAVGWVEGGYVLGELAEE